ncbi:MAG: sensor histidine kinase KdpD [Propionibacteriaceae bacterium]|nr:sensor histidine kinase KdpD [Propionibacteriaceae bacterium]
MARGRLRIYLGAAPGVGKTVAMLDEGHRRAERGTDVVVGLCETHNRAHTAALLEGLELIPRRRVEHKGAVLEEMDLDAVLARRPAVALVDELAHTNVPGSRNEKRWQDIHELLDAGIEVISTVNIQHLESLNDAVTAITGVLQRETVPDEVVRAADQIDLVDMSPEALRRRMAHGNVYKPEKVDAALANYFRVGNLSALRELALLWLADKVDAGLEGYRAAHGITQNWPIRERVVVVLSGGPEGETLLRRGARIASRMAGGVLLAVLVSRTDGLVNAPLSQVAELRRLAGELGGEFHTVTGDDAAEAVLAFARGVSATQILVGASRLRAWQRGFSPSMAEKIIAGSGDIDVHVVTHPLAGKGFGRSPRSGLPGRRVWGGLAAAIGLPPALTAILLADPLTSDLPLDIPIFLLATVVVALIGGVLPAIVAAVLSSLLLNWFFVPPVGTFTIADPVNSLALVVFVLVGVLVALIVHLNARRTEQAEAAQREAAALAELSHSLLGTTDQLPLLLSSAIDMFGVKAAAIVRRPAIGPPQVVAAEGPFDPLATADHEDADGTHELVLQPPGLAAGKRRLFDAFAAHAGAILQRQQLQQSALAAGELARDNAARTALLSAVSHDLRTPLAGIKAAIGSLRSREVAWSAEDEEELKEAIEESTDRLEALVGNLLDMSRLQAGALIAHPCAVDLGEIIPATLATLPDPSRASWEIDPDARTAEADAGLLDRVIGNIAENALRYQPPDRPISVHASRVADRVEIRVADTGVGVPAGEQDRIFQPFQRHGDAPSGDGLGLGLAVARGLTEAMGGRLGAAPTPGGGLTLVITLPVTPGQEIPSEDGATR